jgi:transcriptional regulator with XRE-family HTH domain
MSERESWNELRERRLTDPAARAAYEQANAAYEVGRMIRELREARQLSQRELAARIGTAQSVVGRLEAGGSRPTLATLERVAAALDLRLEIRFAAQRPAKGRPRQRVAGRREASTRIVG